MNIPNDSHLKSLFLHAYDNFIIKISLFFIGEDSLVNEKKKIVESIRHDCENELSEVKFEKDV